MKPQTIQRGFTLVEILTVVMILAITAAVVMPYLGSRDDIKVSAAARVLMSDLMYAQNRAAATQQMQYVLFTGLTNPTGYTLYGKLPAAGNADMLVHPVSLNPYIVRLGAGGTQSMADVAVAQVNFDGKAGLAFDSLGAPWSCDAAGNRAELTNGSIQLTSRDGRVRMTLRVEPFTGELSIQ